MKRRGTASSGSSRVVLGGVLVIGVALVLLLLNLASAPSSTASPQPHPPFRAAAVNKFFANEKPDPTPSPQRRSPPSSEVREEVSIERACFGADEGSLDAIGRELCTSSVRHAAALLEVACGSADTSDCAKRVVSAAKNEPAGLRSAIPTGIEEKWLRAEEAFRKDSKETLQRNAATIPKAVRAKYHPSLWSAILSWSPQAVVAAYSPPRDVSTERRAWRRGMREPGHAITTKTENLVKLNVPVELPANQDACEDRVRSIHFTPHSETFRVIFEGELALHKYMFAKNGSRPSLATPSGDPLNHADAGFGAFSSFHTVYGFAGPRRCALDRLGTDGTHPYIHTKTMRAYENNKWNGFIDNTTGITEAARALFNIIHVATDGRQDATWEEFLWKDLPALSTSLARHFPKVWASYNAWMHHESFFSCFPDMMVLKTNEAAEETRLTSQGAVMVTSALSLRTMPVIRDSSDAVLPEQQRCDACSNRAKEAVRKVTDGSPVVAPMLVGVLPQLLCIHLIPLALDQFTTEEFALYHQAALNYARGTAGGCGRSVVVLHIRFSSRAKKAVESASKGELVDALLRKGGIASLQTDFHLVEPQDLWTSAVDEAGDSAETKPVTDAVLDIALRRVFQNPENAWMIPRMTVARSEHFTDGVPRNERLGMDHAYWDYTAFIPADTVFLPTNFYRYALQQKQIASTHLLRIPRLYAHESLAAKGTPWSIRSFFVYDALMANTLRHALYSATCPLAGPNTAVLFWRCMAFLRMKVTQPTDASGARLVVRGESAALDTVSPFAFALVHMPRKSQVGFWV